MIFEKLEINDFIKKALQEKGFLYSTKIQELVFAEMKEERDILALAPTGTGKTLAFLIPILEKLTFNNHTEALILCPTRELATQIEKELYLLTKYYRNLNTALICGGQRYDNQFKALKKNPSIIVGTTGRIMDHVNKKTIDLSYLSSLVLDEVDEMLNMGFKEDIDFILTNVKNTKNLQKFFFSATMPKEIKELSKRYQDNPITLEVKGESSEKPDIKQAYLLLRESEKITALVSLIKEHDFKLVLVFCNTKAKVDNLHLELGKLGLKSDCLHGDLSQVQRDKAMNKFRSNETEILIATDVAARGIDVLDIEAVFNFDVPQEKEYYVHRIGRTARAGKKGYSYTFATTRTKRDIAELEKITKSVIEKIEYKKFDFNNIDVNKFDKTIGLAKNNDLTVYKDFITEKLEANPNLTLLDIAATLLMKETLPEFLLNDLKETEPENTKVVKYFINVGKREKFTDKKLKDYLISELNLKKDDIKEVFVTDMYSLVRVKKEVSEKIESLSNKTINGRRVNVELSKRQERVDKQNNKKKEQNDFKNGKNRRTYRITRQK